MSGCFLSLGLRERVGSVSAGACAPHRDVARARLDASNELDRWQATAASHGARDESEDVMQKYICEVCGWIYDPAIGDADGGIDPGTPFEEIPNDWQCPVCGAKKEDFEPYEE